MKLIHLSDPHAQLPRWRERKLRQLGPLRALATVELWKGRGRAYDEAADSLRALAQAAAAAADHVVLTGDLTQLGEEEEFALARAALEPLASDPGRFTTLPGNHDRFPLRDFSPNRLFEKYFPEQEHSGSLRVKLVGAELALVLVDTPGKMSWPVISRGQVEERALAALAETLRSVEQHRCKLLLVHHAPVRRGGRQDLPWHRLHGARALLAAAAEGGAAAVLCGHIHDRYDVPAAPGRARVICAGSSTERGSMGYWELEITEGKIASATERSL